MSSGQYDEEAVFHTALELESAHQREAYLQSAWGVRPSMRLLKRRSGQPWPSTSKEKFF
jgi:hypothetical protein